MTISVCFSSSMYSWTKSKTDIPLIHGLTFCQPVSTLSLETAYVLLVFANSLFPEFVVHTRIIELRVGLVLYKLKLPDLVQDPSSVSHFSSKLTTNGDTNLPTYGGYYWRWNSL
jgi:hypothetical protein